MTRRLACAAMLAFLSAGCTGGAPSTTTERQDGSSPLGTGQYRFRPVSGAAAVGRAYAFTLYTHCGVAFLVDFDGAFWDLDRTPEQDTSKVRRPADPGTMTLQDRSTAVFEGGDGARLRFVRARVTRVAPCS